MAPHVTLDSRAMLRRLRVRGYKSLVDCEVELHPLTVVIGPNGAGKSNLLDLMGLLSRLATRETVREAFEGHRGRPLEAFHSPEGFGASAYEKLTGRDRLSFSVECDIELHDAIASDVNRGLEEREAAAKSAATYTRVTERLLRYSLAIAIHPRTGELFVSDERLQALRADLTPKSARKPFVETTTLPGGRRGFVARVERQSHPRYFEPDRTRTLLAELSDPVYHPHVVAAARELASWRGYYGEPRRMRGEIGVQSADEPGREGELLAAYYYGLQQRNPATLRGVVQNLRELVPGLTNLQVDVREGLLEIVATMGDGAQYPARLLSEGTLRLLCVIGIAVAPRPPAVVVYEEPENGVNPARLELIARTLKTATEGRPEPIQVIVTTHSALVCQLLPRQFVICRWSKGKGTEFAPAHWDKDTLFFNSEVIRALDDTSTSRRTARTS